MKQDIGQTPIIFFYNDNFIKQEYAIYQAGNKHPNSSKCKFCIFNLYNSVLTTVHCINLYCVMLKATHKLILNPHDLFIAQLKCKLCYKIINTNDIFVQKQK